MLIVMHCEGSCLGCHNASRTYGGVDCSEGCSAEEITEPACYGGGPTADGSVDVCINLSALVPGLVYGGDSLVLVVIVTRTSGGGLGSVSVK